MSDFIISEFDDFACLTFPALNFSNLKHGVTLRSGGNSSSPYDALNVGLHVGDDPSFVLQNREVIKKSFSAQSLFSAQQTHSNEVYQVTEIPKENLEVKGYDCLITDVKGVLLMIQQADCQAIFLYNPVQNAIGIVHVGWRGSANDAIGQTLSAMQRAYGCNAKNTIAAISPSLSSCCAEFLNYEHELPHAFQQFQVKPFHFDFKAISIWQLSSYGVNPKNIYSTDICTYCDERFFSYRRDGVTGRNASVIGLC